MIDFQKVFKVDFMMLKSFVKSIILNPASHENSSPWICMQILLKAASL